MKLDLRRYIRDIPDFPKPGILFKDITPLLREPAAFRATIQALATEAEKLHAEAVVGIESRGFLFGAPLAEKLGLPFIPVRKPGKLPFDRKSVEYSLEYGSSRLDIHSDALKKGERTLIIDDLLATGGTARAAATLAELTGAQVCGFLFVVELSFLEGRKALPEYPVSSLISYP